MQSLQLTIVTNQTIQKYLFFKWTMNISINSITFSFWLTWLSLSDLESQEFDKDSDLDLERDLDLDFDFDLEYRIEFVGEVLFTFAGTYDGECAWRFDSLEIECELLCEWFDSQSLISDSSSSSSSSSSPDSSSSTWLLSIVPSAWSSKLSQFSFIVTNFSEEGSGEGESYKKNKKLASKAGFLLKIFWDKVY